MEVPLLLNANGTFDLKKQSEALLARPGENPKVPSKLSNLKPALTSKFYRDKQSKAAMRKAKIVNPVPKFDFSVFNGDSTGIGPITVLFAK